MNFKKISQEIVTVSTFIFAILVVSIGYILLLPSSALAKPGTEFGGRSVSAILCDCNSCPADTLIYTTGPTHEGFKMVRPCAMGSQYAPIVPTWQTHIFPYGMIVGAWVLGDYDSQQVECMIETSVGCESVGTGNLVNYMGTSKGF